MKILDCTLRDGGYYNDWDFPKELVDEYLDSVAKANIDYIELGLRNFSQPRFLGAFAYTTEDFLNRLELPAGPVYGVMVDAKTILNSDLSVTEAIDSLFVAAIESKIGLVRVAAHFHEVEACGEIVQYLKSLGYIVGFNLMQAAGKPNELITSMAAEATSWKALDVLYFADSLGNMSGSDVSRIVMALKQGWKGDLGIHTHNNMGRGLDNSLVALENGTEWIDTTITGMGRGAGNTPTENFLSVVKGGKYIPEAIYELVIRNFEPMQKKYGWGSNLLYFLGAQNSVHPTYIQNLLSNDHFGTDEVVGAIKYLSILENSSSYNESTLDKALSFTSENLPIGGENRLVGAFSGRSILVITNAPSTERYAEDIKAFIRCKKPPGTS